MILSEKESESRRMERVNDICRDPEFQETLSDIQKLEADRKFCRHDFNHLVDTARLAYIFSLERNYGLDRSLIYAAALLHDCGRCEEYISGLSHDEAGARFAEKILSRYDYNAEEIERIAAAIRGHRGSSEEDRNTDPLAEVLYDADKMSRECFLCAASGECNWSEEKKNRSLIW